jgi:hypothetical protein
MDGTTTFFFVITALCLFSGCALWFVKFSISRQRRIYWSCTALGGVSGFFCGYPGVGRGLGAAAFVVVVMVVSAMRYSPYLKIGGKIYAFSARDRQARDDDVPDTIVEDLEHVADILQRHYGDDDIPDTTGRNISEALSALRRRSGGDTPDTVHRDTPGDAKPPRPPEPRVRVAVHDAGGDAVSVRVVHLVSGLPLTVGGALMAANPPPPVHRSPHSVTAIGVLCAVFGIYLVAKALRAPAKPAPAQQPTLTAVSAHPHHHAAKASIGESAKLAALCLGVGAAGVGLLWWGISAGLWSVIGMSVVLLGPALVVLASNVMPRHRPER